MTNAIIMELLGDQGNVVRFNCADNVAIKKGDLMVLDADRRVIPHTDLTAQGFMGIACSDKVANDGQTTIGLYTCGLFILQQDDVSSVGARVGLDGATPQKTFELDAGLKILSAVGIEVRNGIPGPEDTLVMVGCGI